MLRMFRAILRLPEFEGDLKHLKKRYQGLDEDLDTLVKALHLWLCLQHQAGQSKDDGYVLMSGYATNGCFLYKVKHMTCRALKGKGNRTGLRVIFAYWPESNTFELIQLYFKADNESEDQQRVKNYVRTVHR